MTWVVYCPLVLAQLVLEEVVQKTSLALTLAMLVPMTTLVKVGSAKPHIHREEQELSEVVLKELKVRPTTK